MIKYIVFCSMGERVLPLFLSCGFIQQQLCYSSCRARNPYDVLGLNKTCSVKEVKEAYIKLCKELHPDIKPEDASQHKKFVELNDAYTTLLNLKCKTKNGEGGETSESNYYSNVWEFGNYDKNKSKDYRTSEKAWYERDKTSEKAWYEREEYQKFYQQHDEDNLANKNFRKANKWVIAGCFILMVVGSFLYLSAYSYATQYTKQTVNERSKKINESYLGVRQSLANKGKDEQLGDLKKKWHD